MPATIMDRSELFSVMPERARNAELWKLLEVLSTPLVLIEMKEEENGVAEIARSAGA